MTLTADRVVTRYEVRADTGAMQRRYAELGPALAYAETANVGRDFGNLYSVIEVYLTVPTGESLSTWGATH
jgi:hypothetical protein